MPNVSFTMYDAVYRDLVQKIETGVFKKGDKLPSVNQLCEMYATSDATIRKSISLLKSDGLIVPVSRVGYFVAESSITGQCFHFNEKKNLKNKPDRYELQELTVIDTAEQGRMIKIDRLYFMDVLPMYYQITYLPFKARKTDFSRISWIDEMDDMFDSHFINKKIEFTVSEDLNLKKKLFILDNMVMFEIKKTYTTKNKDICGYSYIYVPGSEIKITTRQKYQKK